MLPPEAPHAAGTPPVRGRPSEPGASLIGAGVARAGLAAGLRFVANLVTPDNGERYVVEVSNATMTTIKGFQAPKPDLTVTVNRADLNQVMMGIASFDDLIAQGKAKFEGNRSGFDQLRGILVAFTPDFEIMPGTAPKQRATPPKPFEVRQQIDVEVD